MSWRSGRASSRANAYAPGRSTARIRTLPSTARDGSSEGLGGNDTCVVGLAEFGQCRVIRRRLGGGQSRTQRSELHQLGVAELARDERGAILAKQVDCRGLADKNNRQQQEREPAEQRARPQRQSQAPSLGVAGSSGTNT